MKSIMKTIVSLTCVASAATFAWAAPKDITSHWNPKPDGSPASSGTLNVEARYNVHVGFEGNNPSSGMTTAAGAYNARGLAEYTSSGGNSGNWGRINNGLTVFANPVTDGTTQENFTSNTFGGFNPDFAGYVFNCPCTVTQVRWWNRVYVDGGTFGATPAVQYLDAMEPLGSWHTVPATWSVPYDTSFGVVGTEVRRYDITLTTPVSGVWGIRLIGDGKAGPVAADPTGWIGVQELVVIGELELGDTVITKNKAVQGGATPIANAEQGAGQTVWLNDGNVNSRTQTYGPWDAEDYVGITWTTPQNRITTLGVCFMGFFDGGYFNDNNRNSPMRIEYTSTTESNWTPVPNLNKGRYPYVQQRISYINGNPQLGFLFHFDELNGVTGLRIIGDPDGDGGDADGFLGIFELEVFGKRVVGEIVNYDASVDGDVDATDLGLFISCWSGPMVPYTTGCADRDLDQDNDVDEDDFGVFQRCYSGPGNAADPFCG